MRILRAVAILAAVAAAAGGAVWYCSGRGYGPARKQELSQWIRSTPAGSASPGLLKAGAYRVDITPHSRVPLAGYGARHGRLSRGIHDRLYAKALVLSNGTQKLAIVGCDMISTSKRLRRKVLERLKDRGFSSDNVMICASHSHSSFGGVGPELVAQLFVGRFHPEMPRFVEERIAAAIRGADDALEPAAIGVGEVQAPDFVSNRRSEDSVRPINPDLTVLKVVDANGEPLAVLCNYSAHATCIGPGNMLFSGDYPGYLQRAVEKALGGKTTCIFTIGTDADQSPQSPPGPEGFDRARAVGEGLAREALRILPGIEVKRRVSLAVRTFPLRLPLTPLSTLLSTSTVVQAMAIGDFLVFAVPGELCAEIGKRLEKEATSRVGFSRAAVFCIANDHVGYYILTPKQMRHGGYEAAVSFYGPQLGPLMEDAMASAGLAVGRMLPSAPVQPGRRGAPSTR